jgi:FKBP-type peptidyl-prolyl cis-trans isomerase FklB
MEALQKRNEEKEATTGGNNLSDSLEFLEKNAKREGIIVTSSGLQYEILRSNSDPNSPKPGITDQVEVHYHGTLIDGTVFDSSIQRGQTVTFPVAGVIPGWTEALQLMSVGDKWKLYLPPSIAYGSRQTASIPGNSALIFEVELIRILNGEGETIESP